MTWQTPPQQYASTPGPASQYPGQGPTPSTVLRWAISAGVVCLLLVGAVVLHQTVLSRIFGGASSPQEAVNRVITAIENNDLTQLGLFLPPDEVAGLTAVTDQVKRISSSLDQETGFGDAKNTGLQVSVNNLQLKKTDEQDGLTKVSIENADITASFDPSRAPGPVKKYFDRGNMAAKTTTITVRGADVTTDGNTHTLTLNGREQAPFVMTVERGGSWYVDPLFTYLQYASEEGGYATSPAINAPGFDSPVDAAKGYASALVHTINNRDITEFARATGGFEGRLLQTYRDLINARINTQGNNQFSITLDDSQFRELSVSGNTARIRPEQLRLTTTSDGETTAINWDGQCLKVGESRAHRRTCLNEKSTIGPFAPLVERLEYVVAVRSDGDWKVSATRTVFTMIADVLSWVGDAEMPIIKAVVHADPTEVTKGAKIAGTVSIGSSSTIHVERIGPYVDGGYVVVDIPDPEGQQFELRCRSRKSECNVVGLVTPSGKPQDRNEGGYNGESGTYKAIVVAAAGDTEVYAEAE